MTNLIIHEYYYRYREKRKQIKNLVDAEDYQTAQTQLDSTITEHIAKYPDSDQRKDFNYGEKIAMQHAKAHLDYVISAGNDPPFTIDRMDGSPITTGHHSDIVKEALLHTPKSDYSEVLDQEEEV